MSLRAVSDCCGNVYDYGGDGIYFPAEMQIIYDVYMMSDLFGRDCAYFQFFDDIICKGVTATGSYQGSLL